MVSEKVVKALNEQIKFETESAYLYLAMAADLHEKGFDGMASWMRVQAKEELEHAMKFFDHLTERNARVELQAISQPKTSWSSPLEIFEEAYKHEQFITGKINDLVRLANEVSDYPAGILLQWFVTEQVEEEANTSKAAEMLRRIGNSGSGLVMIDRQFGKRAQ